MLLTDAGAVTSHRLHHTSKTGCSADDHRKTELLLLLLLRIKKLRLTVLL